ncbi:UDP-GlcNAc:betaGal beta-1,3-N-acetylglucosaminyltransferase 2, isoform CRA_b [Mus musculus]|nr:UDP-GlcNAc:betaGal beta-1,3-N-acetylglucosaminyltransferase 2, isoform CRA_b [Mus musculus]EDL07869.1 UDP-GlcNAc:betaGal beta-1,3-N-acetylglucosaminyltransferase 2, isoform CRA_b [Mus musculus]
MRDECGASKSQVAGHPDDGKCLHLFDCGSLQKQ